ncbi:hypothetical protein ACFWI0_32865 [[Kitasatospora] papulosa]|uniref:hypothetical protein n=1 Tax=[Kitasatospora] papulosa TaxID=1464011 RepID=UPI00365897D4
MSEHLSGRLGIMRVVRGGRPAQQGDRTMLIAPSTMRTLSAVTGSSNASFLGSATVHVDSGMDLTSR